MKNNLWLILISIVITLSSCITAAQFNNAEDDVYYSPKASNRKQPVMIPEVDIDEIIRENPPKYGEPTNRLDEEYYSNPMAAMYYPTYRSFPQDTTYSLNPRVSSYIDPSLATQRETEEAAYLRQVYSSNSNQYVGLGLNWFGQLFSLGYSNYNTGYNNCNSYYYPYGYPSTGCGYYGYGYNNYYNPYYCGAGYGWYGGGYYYPPTHVTPHNDNVKTGVSRPRPTVGSNTPPAPVGRSTNRSNDPSPSGRYVAPSLPVSVNQPTKAELRRNRRAARVANYTPSAPQQTLENENGRQVYKRQAETTQPASQSSETKPAYSNRGSSTRRQTSNEESTSRTTNPKYSAPSQNVSTPSNSGRSTSNSQGNTRSSGNSNSGSQNSGSRRR